MSATTEALSLYQDKENSLMDILRYIQSHDGFISADGVRSIAENLKISSVDVKGVISFYHFFTEEHSGKYSIYLNNNPVSFMMGREKTARALEKEVGIDFESTSDDQSIGLYSTSCIGMNDQEPSAIINGHVFTSLTEDKIPKLITEMKSGKDMEEITRDYYGGKFPIDGIAAGVLSNIRQKGKVIFAPYEPGAGLRKALDQDAEKVIDIVKEAGLRGRGGAGFPAGMKWNFCNMTDADEKYVVCNCDEGEPGTFKDRVILTEVPEKLFEGMAIAGYALQAKEGIIYIRGEYIYLQDHLEAVLQKMRDDNLLGNGILGSPFNFDISIKWGAGAYVCGEESALIESAEGKRGEPRNRPPFPVQLGYKNKPTVVNNVETYTNIPVILDNGAQWYNEIGSVDTKGTKVLSISGDCEKPGIYEIDFGTTLGDVLALCGGEDAQAVQVGGPSGQCVSSKAYGRKICFNDLSTGGSIIIIGKERNLLEVVHNFMEFFVEESCGWCVPCRAGNVILTDKLEKIIHGKASQTDLQEIRQWGETVKAMSRCGLGQTSPNPILTTLENFPEVYNASIESSSEYITQFDMAASVEKANAYVGRESNIKE